MRKMPTLLVKDALLVVTMDDHRREITDGGFFVRDGFIEQIGKSNELPQQADEIVSLRDHIVLPGKKTTD